MANKRRNYQNNSSNNHNNQPRKKGNYISASLFGVDISIDVDKVRNNLRHIDEDNDRYIDSTCKYLIDEDV